MINNKRVIAVLPAYNAAKTLEATVRELPETLDGCILVDDGSGDDTAALARKLGLTVFVHSQNRGYGANQKTCYSKAIAAGAEVIVMIHPDYQYSPRLVTALASMVAFDVYDVALGSRILGGEALKRGMPVYKYFSNRTLTAIQNSVLATRVSEFHTGFRAFSRELLEALPLSSNSDDFVFDNEVLCQAILMGARVGEISCPAQYFPEASSINLRRSVTYGLGVVRVCGEAILAKVGLGRFRELHHNFRRGSEPSGLPARATRNP